VIATRSLQAWRRPGISSPAPRPKWRSFVAAGGLAIALVGGAVQLCWALGASSLFVDEVASWRAAHVPVGELLHRVRVYEVAPPLYYLLLHGWIGLTGSDGVVEMRLLSVIAAVALVAAVWWLTHMIAGGFAATLASIQAAVSPLVLEYGQEVRAYAWTMLLVTIATACVVRALDSRTHSSRWLAVACLTSAAALWFQYSAALVVIPLTAWVMRSRGLGARHRAWFVSGVALAGSALLPLLHAQLSTGNANAVAGIAQLSLANLERVVGAPFDRTYNVLLSWEAACGAVAVAVAVGLLLIPISQKRIRRARLVASLAGCAPLTLLVLTAAGRPELISRYDAVAVPFIIVALAVTVISCRPVGALLFPLVLGIAISGSVAAHEPANAYPDTRAAVRFVARHWHRGDVLIVGTGYPAYPYNLEYYVVHLLPRGASVVYTQGLARFSMLIARRSVRGIALVSDPLGPIAGVERAFARVGYPVVAAKSIAGTVPMQAFVSERSR
jgi:mannosyltransferase